ncbi:MAG: helix-turn-helix domain-containing protein [Clostridia bacterium]|nr:helix-turn-helix domain-containing protein [Clostridia bacterium]
MVHIYPLKNNLRQIRVKEYDMTATDFAEFLGVKLGAYSSWELGNSFPSLRKAYAIAEKLSRPITDIWYKG